MAGDVSRVARTSTDSRFSVEALMAVFLERFSGLLVTLLFIGSVMLLGGYQALGRTSLLVMLLVVLLPLAVFVVLFNVHWARRVLRALPDSIAQRVEGTAAKIRYSFTAVTSQPALILQIGVLSLVFILLTGPLSYFVALSVNFPVPLHVLIVYVPLIALLSNLPISIAGVGVRENLSVFFYSSLGFLPEDIIAFALSGSALMILVNLSGGVVLLLRPAQSYPKSKEQARWL